jgi:hypothetical protein
MSRTADTSRSRPGRRAIRAALFAAVAFAGVHDSSRPFQAALVDDDGCPQTSAPETQTGTTLQQFAEATDGGVVYDDSVSKLRLQKAGGLFKATSLLVSDTFNAAAAADFDEDGWTDLIVGASQDRFIRFYKNRTYENPAPDWNDSDDIRTPNFVRTVDVVSATATQGHTSIVSGDFNGDGHQDFAYFKNTGDDYTYLDYYKLYLGDGDGTFDGVAPYDLIANVSHLGYFVWSSTNAVAADWNRDGWLDIIFGTKILSADNRGGVIALINNCPDVYDAANPTKCSTNPMFTRTTILQNHNFGSKGLNAIAFADFNGDSRGDLIIGSPSFCSAVNSKPVWIYPGIEGGISSTPTKLTHTGAATVMLAADFSLDGKLDFIYGTDNWSCGSNLGAQTFYFQNNGSSTQPIKTPHTQSLPTRTGSNVDFDLGVVLDYDGDPDATPDFLIADGNDSGTFTVFANRVVTKYVDCGDVSSGVIDLGGLEGEEMVVTSARMKPTMTVPTGTSLKFFMSNEEPANWQEASLCTGSTTDYCVSFIKPVGTDVRWKATMCSDTATNTLTPDISGVELKYDYTVATEHYRAGVVVHDGVAYVGAFRQPGDRGHFYAINAGLSETYWDAGDKLDEMADSARNMYTATVDGTMRLDFSLANAASEELRLTLGAADETQVSEIIEWQRSARFGLGTVGVPKTKLGAVETSTAAILSAPQPPPWYNFLDGDGKAEIDEFVADHADRFPLALFGSKDGALHAVYTDAPNISSMPNGTEAWAFIPAKVAFDFRGDMASDTASAYPDGSPTLTEVRLSDGELHTVAIVSGGNGSKSVFALDVTETVDEDSGAVVGPTPLWHATPGDEAAGQAYTKPVVARLKIADEEKFYAIFGTGLAYDDADPPYSKGRTVTAIDVATGETKWQFIAKCAVTSDFTLFETDDETGTDHDGYVDRVVFADACGYLYKMDPASAGPWNQSLGPITVLEDDGTPMYDESGQVIRALFYNGAGTVDYPGTSGARGEERPIAGTLGARTDNSSKLILFFGTGGVEQYDPTKQNDFYAVYADTGEIRSREEGDCLPDGRCEKFYGGVVITTEQVIVTRSYDPPVGSAVCDYGSSKIQGFELDPPESGGTAFSQDFIKDVGSAMLAALYATGNAVYTATLGGEILRVGTPRAANAGDDTAGGYGGGFGDGGEGGGADLAAMTLLGWRQVF